MKFEEMEKLIPYRVIVPSSDGTFKKDAIIWMSPNGDINDCMDKGWITPSECDIKTLDFEVEDAKDFEIIKISGSEICQKKDNANGCECCSGDQPLFWQNDENNAFVDSHGEMFVTAKDREVHFQVKFCPNCGRKF